MASPLARSRKGEIVDAAMHLFKIRGFHGTRMDDVADQIGLNKATLYHYYRSKADILYDIFLRATEAGQQLLAIAAVGDDQPALEALRAHTRATLRQLATDPTLTAVYYQERPFLREWLNAAQVAEIARREHDYENFLRALIERGVDEGAFVVSDTDAVTTAYIGMTTWAFHNWYRPKYFDRLDTISDAYCDLIIFGLAGPPK
jgi:AcrR family transcriptional regulator